MVLNITLTDVRLAGWEDDKPFNHDCFMFFVTVGVCETRPIYSCQRRWWPSWLWRAGKWADLCKKPWWKCAITPAAHKSPSRQEAVRQETRNLNFDWCVRIIIVYCWLLLLWLLINKSISYVCMGSLLGWSFFLIELGYRFYRNHKMDHHYR